MPVNAYGTHIPPHLAQRTLHCINFNNVSNENDEEVFEQHTKKVFFAHWIKDQFWILTFFSVLFVRLLLIRSAERCTQKRPIAWLSFFNFAVWQSRGLVWIMKTLGYQNYGFIQVPRINHLNGFFSSGSIFLVERATMLCNAGLPLLICSIWPIRGQTKPIRGQTKPRKIRI